MRVIYAEEYGQDAKIYSSMESSDIMHQENKHGRS